jgi:2-keto-3-deoxy-L-rhamnonate aldolase RhmA
LAKTILNNGKFDWVLIDGEHGLISDKDYYDVSSLAILGDDDAKTV